MLRAIKVCARLCKLQCSPQVCNARAISYKKPILQKRLLSTPAQKSYVQTIIDREKILSKIKSRKFLFGGLTIGLATTFGVYYKLKDPEKTITTKIKQSFDEEHNLAAKLAYFAQLPEQKVPVDSDDDVGELKKPITIDEWAQLITEVKSNMNKSLLFKTMKYMRDSLIDYIKGIENIDHRIQGLKKIYPNSLELQLAINSELEEELKKNKWIDTKILEGHNVTNKIPYSLEAELLKKAIISFPEIDKMNELIEYLQGSRPENDLTFGNESVHISMNELKNQFQNLHPVIQNYVIEGAIKTLINKAPKEAYDVMIDKYLLSRLATDPEISKFADHLGTIFKALPVHVQAKMLMTTFKKHDNNIIFMKTLLGNAGIVAIKLGQIMSEDPLVPEAYREVFSELRDTNEPQGLLDFWNTIPLPMRGDIKKIGKLLGTGSVKDVMLGEMKNGDIQAIALIRKGIEDDALATLKALGNIKQITGLVNRIKKMVFKEMDLALEYEAFEELKKTGYGKDKYISIPDVNFVAIRCLIRDLADGKTLAKIFAKGQVEDPKHSIIMQAVESLHKTAIKVAFEEGIIMSDLHFGNIVFNPKSNQLVLFDVGQLEKLEGKQINALLWTLVATSTKERMKQFKRPALKYLMEIAECPYDDKKKLHNDLNKIYDMCVDVKDSKWRFLHLLANAEKENITLPIGFFASAKMADTLKSQEELLKLHGTTPGSSIVEDEIYKILKKKMSISDAVSIAISSIA